MAHVTADSFYSEDHQVIWSAMLDLYWNGFPIDAVTLVEHIDRPDIGVIQIAELFDTTCTSYNAEYYARIVEKKKDQRDALRFMSIMEGSLYEDPDMDAHVAMSEFLLSKKANCDFEFVCLDRWWEVGKIPWLFDRSSPIGDVGMIPDNQLTIIACEGGTGKSLFTLGLSLSMASGRCFWPSFRPCSGGDVLFLSAEDDQVVVKNRMLYYSHLNDKYNWMPHEEFRKVGENNFHLMSGGSRSLIEYDERRNLKFTNAHRALVSEVRSHPYKLVVIDTLLAHCGGASENDSNAMQFFVDACNVVCREGSCAVVALHHSIKMTDSKGKRKKPTKDSVRGSSAIVNGARAVFVAEKDQNTFELTLVKANNDIWNNVNRSWYFLDGKEVTENGTPVYPYNDRKSDRPTAATTTTNEEFNYDETESAGKWQDSDGEKMF